MELFSVKEKVILITGGYGVLGSSMAIALAKAGAKIALLGRTKAKAESLMATIKLFGGETIFLQADVLCEESLNSAKAALLEAWGTLDVLINAAGGNMPGAVVTPEQTIFDIKVGDMDSVFALNFKGTLLPTMVFADIMTSKGDGSIINVSSMAAITPITRVAGYGAAKAAINNFTAWLSVELCKKFGEGVRVNAIAPGFFLTEQNRTLLTNPDGTPTERTKDILRSTPYNRLGKPEELHGVIFLLCSEASKFMTGTVIPVDGGFSVFSGV